MDASGRERWYRTIVRAGARGMVAAMAMTGARTVSAALGPHQKSPPEAIVEEHGPERLKQLSQRQREALTEIIHWMYGAGGGVMFGLLPNQVRNHRMIGPVYGLLVWLGYELAIAPLLGIEHARHRRATWRAVVAIDHILYGIVVADQLAPEPSLGPLEQPRK